MNTRNTQKGGKLYTLRVTTGYCQLLTFTDARLGYLIQRAEEFANAQGYEIYDSERTIITHTNLTTTA